jgi:biotin transport system ATP-binding protein
MNPEILVFDEPFSNLDYQGGQQLLNQIIRLHKSGHSIIVVTHELEKVISHAAQLILMEDGNIVRSGNPDTLMGEVEAFGVREPCTSKYGLGLRSWLS